MRNDKVIKREDLKNTKAEEIENPRQLLEACVNSLFYNDGLAYPVAARFIRKTANGGAIIHIRNDQGHEYFGTVSSFQDTYAYATDLDIFIDEQDKYHFVLEKIVSSDETPTQLTLEPVPSLKAEAGEYHSLVPSLHKGSTFFINDEADQVKSRVLYTLTAQESVFVVRTLKNKIYMRRGPSADLSTLLVPGDFYMYQSTDDLIYQVYGMDLNSLGFIRPATSPMYVVPPQA